MKFRWRLHTFTDLSGIVHASSQRGESLSPFGLCGYAMRISEPWDRYGKTPTCLWCAIAEPYVA